MITRLSRNEQVAIMADPSSWRLAGVLPLTRGADLGVLTDWPARHNITGYRATVFRANAFMLPGTIGELLDLPKDIYDTPDEIYDAGWRVD